MRPLGAQVGGRVIAVCVQGIVHHLARPLDQRLGVAHMDEAARDDVGAGDEAARSRGRPSRPPSGCRPAPVPGGRAAPRRRSRRRWSRRRRRSPPGTRPGNRPRVVGVSSITEPFSTSRMFSGGMPICSPSRLCQVRWRYWPWTGMRKLRPQQAEHQLELVLRAVARDVDLLVAVVDHVGAQLEQVVDVAAHHLLVAGDRRGRDDHGIAVLDGHVALVAVGHARQRGGRLALAARRDDADVLVGQLERYPRS